MLFVACQMGYHARGKVAHFYVGAAEQADDMSQQIFCHQLGRELSDFSYVVLQGSGTQQGRKGERIRNQHPPYGSL